MGGGSPFVVVQIKRYAPHRPINLDAVAALEAHVNREGANRGLFITSSRFLPGVKTFANRQKHRLQLAEPTDLQQWCEASAQATRTARNRTLAMESFASIVEEIGMSGTHPRLIVGGKYGPSFCVVLRETTTSALLVHIPRKQISGDALRGQVVPLLDGHTQDPMLGSSVFRAIRSVRDGRVSYWGQRNLYHVWDGQPCGYDHWD